MQPILVQLEQIDKTSKGLKEHLFEWVADVTQREFDQLCAEILALQNFFNKYDGAVVADPEDIIGPVKSFLLKTELVIEFDEFHFDKTYFYRWLEEVSMGTLRTICAEVEDAYDQVVENLDTFVVTHLIDASRNQDICWQIRKNGLHFLPLVANRVVQWKTPSVKHNRMIA